MRHVQLNEHDDSCPSMIEEKEETVVGNTQRQEILKGIEKQLKQLQSCIPELQALSQAFSVSATQPIQQTGLVSYIASLHDEEISLQHLKQELEALESVSENELLPFSKKLAVHAADVAHASIRWNILKHTSSLVAIQRNFQGSARDDRRKHVSEMGVSTGREKHQMHRTLKERGKVEVDIVCGGFEWIDIRWINSHRLLQQMTDSGWCWGDHEIDDCVDEDEWEDVSLAKQLRRLISAARINRHEYAIPRIRLILPNLNRDSKEIEIFLSQLQMMDSSVEVMIEDSTSQYLTRSPPELQQAVDNLVGKELDGLSETLNMDHTILVDLISDLTHSKLEPQPWQAATTRSQIMDENAHSDGVMLRTLYPILKGRKLICTREAAEHFHDMLKTVGTASECERGRLLVPIPQTESTVDDSSIRKRFADLSIHPIPHDLQIPISILPDTDRWNISTVAIAVSAGTLPKAALQVAERGVGGGQLKSSKLSIYMYGWWSGYSTVTSNKEVKAQMRTSVEMARTHDDERGPRIWCIGVTRNLLAKSASPPAGWQKKD